MKLFGFHITRNSPDPFSRGDGYHLLNIIRQHITNSERLIMITLQDLKARIIKLSEDVEAQKANVASLIGGLRDQIANLSAGQPLTQEDLQGLADQLGGIDTAVQGISSISAVESTQAVGTVDRAVSQINTLTGFDPAAAPTATPAPAPADAATGSATTAATDTTQPAQDTPTSP